MFLAEPSIDPRHTTVCECKRYVKGLTIRVYVVSNHVMAGVDATTNCSGNCTHTVQFFPYADCNAQCTCVESVELIYGNMRWRGWKACLLF